MYITLETDYAIRIVDCLTRSKCRLGAQAIADSTNVTLRFSLKILSKLVKSGIVNSFKGAHGGYEINRQAKDISINDILESIEGVYKFNRCLGSDHKCIRKVERKTCAYHIFFSVLSEDIREKLKGATLDKFIEE